MLITWRVGWRTLLVPFSTRSRRALQLSFDLPSSPSMFQEHYHKYFSQYGSRQDCDAIVGSPNKVKKIKYFFFFLFFQGQFSVPFEASNCLNITLADGGEGALLYSWVPSKECASLRNLRWHMQGHANSPLLLHPYKLNAIEMFDFGKASSKVSTPTSHNLWARNKQWKYIVRFFYAHPRKQIIRY